MAEAVAIEGGMAGTPGRQASRWMAWAHRGVLSVLDQGLFAGANFVLNILLARWLVAVDYGAFALTYSVFLFVGAFYLALFMEPFLIFAAGTRKPEFGRYLSLILRSHWWVTAGVSVAVALAAGVVLSLGHQGQASALIGMAVALPFLLQLWLMRTAFYARTEPKCSALGSAVFFVGQVGGVVALRACGWLSPCSAFIVSGLASCVAGFVLRLMLRGAVADAPRTAGDGREYRRGVLRDHVRYARWATGVSVIAWLCANVHYFILTSAGGLAAVGAMKVLDNLMTPFYQCITALGQLLQPAVVSRAGDRRAFIRATAVIAGIWLGIGLVGCATLWVFGHLLLVLLFGPERVALEGPLRLFAFVTIPYTLIMALMLGLRAKVRTDLVFAYHLLFAVVLTVAYLFSARYGLFGIVWSNLGTRLAFLPVIVVLFLRAAGEPRKAPEGSVVNG